MIKPYTSQQPVDDFGLMFPDLKYSAILAASADTALVVPGNAQRYKALIKCSFSSMGGPGALWVAWNAVAAAPAGASFASTTSEFTDGIAPLCREVRAGDVLHFLTTDTGVNVSVVFYALNTNN
jgi:hypothetical protein